MKHHSREGLPPPKETRGRMSLWSLVQAMAKNGDLARSAASGIFPAAVYEPVSELQRRAESTFTCSVLDQAAKEDRESDTRLLLVAAFNIAQWSSLCDRVNYRAFRPAASETFELVHPERHMKAVFEQTVTDNAAKDFTASWKVWGRQWSLQAESRPTAHFKMLPLPRMEYDINYRAEVTFADGDCYILAMPPGVITGLARDRQVLSYKGAATVKNVRTGDCVEADLREPGKVRNRGGGRRRVRGSVFKQGRRLEDLQLSGRWDEQITACWSGKKQRQQVLWEKPAVTSHPDNLYGFSQDTIQLNHLPSELATVLPPTDTRFRPDIRALEHGLFDEVEAEQRRIAGLQAERDAEGEPASAPAWFEPQPAGSWLRYRYKGGYWEARASKSSGNASAWAACSDAFGLGPEYDKPRGEFKLSSIDCDLC